MRLDKSAISNAPSPARSPESSFTGILWEISASPSGSSMLRLSGDLKPGWLGKLSAYVSLKKINIISGTAQKTSPLQWESNFELAGHHSHHDPFKGFNPLPALMGTGSAEQVYLPPPKISDFKIEYVPLHRGSLYVEISGKDCIGFLSGILSVFSFYSLFPMELEIATKGKIAGDRFWLKGIGASVPIKDDMVVLNERLEMMRG